MSLKTKLTGSYKKIFTSFVNNKLLIAPTILKVLEPILLMLILD